MGVDNIMLCHSRFILKDKTDKENFISKLFGKNSTQRPKRYIIVTTQVLEACLDLDFDMCFSDIAPIDILVQRLGRVHRFDDCENRERGKLVVFTSTDNLYGDSSYIYAELFLKETELYLKNRCVLRLPEQLRESLDSVYGIKTYTSEGDILLLFTQKQKEFMEEHLALRSVITVNNTEFSVKFTDVNTSTRLINSETLILLDKTQGLSYNTNKSLTHEEYKDLMLHSFSCPRNFLDEKFHIKTGKLTGNYLLNMQNGLYTDNINQYSYSVEKGFMVEKL